MNDPLSMYDNNETLNQGNNNSDNNNETIDGVFAKLTDLFGDVLTSDVIFSVCSKLNWKLEDCIESLINATDQHRNVTKMSNNLHIQHAENNAPTNCDNDMDIVVESEEIQCVIADTSNKLKTMEQELHDIQTASQSTFDNRKPFTYSGAIKKANRKLNNSTDIVDAPYSIRPLRSNTETRMSNYFYDRPHLQKIANDIIEGFKVMVFMRGPPGCGKSFLAREIIDATTRDEYGNHIFSTDDFFYDQRGRYNFNTYQLGEAHDWNKARVERSTRDGWSPIIVDNTNIKTWEMNNYFEIGVRHGYLLQIVEPKTSWSRSAGKLAMKNSHNVPKENIERMMLNYEFTTVKYVMESIGLKYTIEMPQYRQIPPLPYKDIVPKAQDRLIKSNDLLENSPKPQRSSTKSLKPSSNETSTQIPDVVQCETLEGAFQQIQRANLEWTAFEQERHQFWNTAATPVSPIQANRNWTTSEQERTLQGTQFRTTASIPVSPMPSKPQRKRNTNDIETTKGTKGGNHSNLYALLKQESENVVDKSSTEDDDQPSDENEAKEKIVLHKHRKNCKNENNSFAQIRQIYPAVPIDFLWDLFEKCEGDGDWTMDILLKEETRIGDYENLDNDEDKAKDDFDCGCEKSGLETLSKDLASSFTDFNLHMGKNLSSKVSSPQRSRRANNAEEILVTKRMIEENFKIGDEHYSRHTRKIRDIRRGVNSEEPSAIVECVPNEEGACAIDNDEAQQIEEEIVEINLGMELVCQLDSVFGIEAYQQDAIKDMKTNVFMPKSLAQQLYALWMESLYNQLEEQRQKSIREDAEFARQLQSQQIYPGLYKHTKPPTDLKDIIEMEYAWAAYKTDVDDWRSKTPQDLASQMTRDKLCEIFPNIKRDTLIEVLVAHDNKFAETVEVLKDTLQDNVINKIENEGCELFEQAIAEVETTTSNDFQLVRSTSTPSVRLMEMKKLGPEEANRSALKEFEDCRNLAMHHTQLKAECYNKAKDAIQRNNTSVALYYSQIANLHKNKIDMYNHKAANCIMEVHNLRQNNPDMLDLHYLHVNEAIECLDLFLDKHIAKLKTMPQPYKHIFIITGRGLHSVNGISTIKQRVKNRFRERHLPWSEVNPGLLRVKIFINSRLTVNL